MAFVRRPVDDPTLLTELVAVDDVVAVLPDDHPLAAQQSIPLAALAGDAWVVPPASASRACREMLLADCGHSGFGRRSARRRLHLRPLSASSLPEPVCPCCRRDPTRFPVKASARCRLKGEESVVVMAWREDRRTPIASIFMSLARQIAHPDGVGQSGAGRPRSH